MERNTTLSINKSEGLSLTRAQGVNRQEEEHFYNLLENTLLHNDLQDKPGRIFNTDETGIQLINKPTKVIAAKSSKCAFSITSKERGETL